MTNKGTSIKVSGYKLPRLLLSTLLALRTMFALRTFQLRRGRALPVTRRAARKLPTEPEVLELDVTDPAHLHQLTESLAERHGRVDGVVHAIGFAPREAIEGGERWRLLRADRAGDGRPQRLHLQRY